MKMIRTLFLVATALLLQCAPSFAQSVAWPHGFGIGGQNADTTVFSGRSANVAISGTVHSNLAYFITSAAPAGVPRVTYVSSFSDAGTLLPLTTYVSTNSVQVTNATVATNAFSVASTATLATNDLLVLRGSNDTYQLLVVSNIASATLFSTFQFTTNAVAVNDILYEQTAAGAIPVANATLGTTTAYSVPQGLFHGTEGKPLLITIGGSNATPSLHVVGEYYRRLRP